METNSPSGSHLAGNSLDFVHQPADVQTGGLVDCCPQIHVPSNVQFTSNGHITQLKKTSFNRISNISENKQSLSCVVHFTLGIQFGLKLVV